MATFNFTTDQDKIAFAGDWHGNGNYAARQITRLAGEGVKVILHAGDLMYDFEPRFIGKMNKALEESGMTLFWVDGNHENFDKLYQYPVNPDTGFRKITNRIYHIPRGHRWEWQGVTFMGLGGAVSVDKQWRTPGYSWWPQETVSLGDVEFALTDTSKIDVFISHDTPFEVAIPGIETTGPNLSGFPTEEILAAREHRKALSLVTNELQPWLLVHGHYHRRYDATFKYWNGFEAQVAGLDCDDNAPIHNAVTMRMEDLQLASAFHKAIRPEETE